MKILNIFNHYLEKGGEAHAVAAICDSLAQVSDLERLEFSSSDWAGPNAPPRWQQAVKMIRNPQSLRLLHTVQARSAADCWLVHNVFPVGSAAIYREARRLEVPIVQYLHNYRPFSVNSYLWADGQLAPQGLTRNYWPEIAAGAWQDSRLRTAWFAGVLSLMHALGWWQSVKVWIAVSEFVRDRFVEAGIPAERVVTLRHFWRPQAGARASAGEHYLYLGRLTDAKGVRVLLDAWEIMEAEMKEATPALLIAGSGPLERQVRERAARTKSVKFLGEISGEHKMHALESARAIVVPSLWWEPLGLVVYEGYDYSLPVLAARSGGLAEIVREGQTGLLHTPGDAAELSRHVLELERNCSLAMEMGVAGRRWLEENANETDWQRRFLEIAHSAIAHRS